MYPLAISLYEFGQFLYILLWIFLPAFTILLLVNTYLQYRSKQTPLTRALAFSEGFAQSSFEEQPARPGEEWPAMERRPADDPAPISAAGEGEDENWNEDSQEKIYKGILFMKEKFERYREEADRRYDRVKEELAKSEKKYYDLLHSPSALVHDLVEEKNKQIAYLQSQLDQRIQHYHQLESRVDELAGKIEQEQGRSEELVGKLQDNTRLLMNIYKELDRSLNQERAEERQPDRPEDQQHGQSSVLPEHNP
jgi:hypothetical protein